MIGLTDRLTSIPTVVIYRAPIPPAPKGYAKEAAMLELINKDHKKCHKPGSEDGRDDIDKVEASTTPLGPCWEYYVVHYASGCKYPLNSASKFMEWANDRVTTNAKYAPSGSSATSTLEKMKEVRDDTREVIAILGKALKDVVAASRGIVVNSITGESNCSRHDCPGNGKDHSQHLQAHLDIIREINVMINTHKDELAAIEKKINEKEEEAAKFAKMKERLHAGRSCSSC
jgi:hypothetical protein